MSLIPYILMMVFVSLILLVAMGAMTIVVFLMRQEARRLTNGKGVEAKLETLAAAVRAVERDNLGLSDLVATFGNRAAVKAQRAKKRKEVAAEDEQDVVALHPELFGGGNVEPRQSELE